MLCKYGCGQKANYQLKNGSWCCKDNHRKCPAFIENVRQSNLGKKRNKEFKENQRKRMIGNKNPCYNTGGYWLGKKRSEEDIKKFVISHRQEISDIEQKYPFFSQIEEMRYNPDKPGEKEIQVRCKNHNCLNSKEKGGWFTPTYIQLYERIRNLEYNGKDICYLYCSNNCKQQCPLYGLKNDPFENIELSYTQEEYRVWREEVLKRDNYECQKCGSKENLHAHHIHPVKLEPGYALDPSNGITLCEDCHYEIGHKDECSTGKLANIICI